MSWFRNPEVFIRHRTTEADWRDSYDVASSLMGYPFGADLDLSVPGTRIYVRIPSGRISSLLYPISIQIGAGIAFANTSPNFRFITLAHEISHIELSNSPISIFMTLGYKVPRIRLWTERMANRGVVDQIRQKSTEKERRESIYRWAEELFTLRNMDSSALAVEQYIARNFPYI